MNTATRCISCFVRQAVEAVYFCTDNESERADIMCSLLSDLAEINWKRSPADVAQRLHRLVRKKTGNPDPYCSLKKRMNALALELLPEFLEKARRAKDLETAITRLALAGNLIDAGAKTNLSEKEIRGALARACGEPVVGSAKALFEEANRAKSILFLADNSGEIIFDRALIEALPTGKITLGVRGFPVLNDATMEDARAAGLCGIVPVIPNGSDAPGTLLEDCSPEFRTAFETSDLIIAKGQGNYESLHATKHHIFSLLRVQVDRVAADIGAPVGQMVIYERNRPARPGLQSKGKQ